MDFVRNSTEQFDVIISDSTDPIGPGEVLFSEDFASAGIGHFIWYPAGAEGPYRESFPELLAFLSSRGVPLPAWLAVADARDCPWPTREKFLQQRYARKATELRRLLADTVALQAEFMLARLESALEPYSLAWVE